jgi:hypothetical protein
MNPSTSTPRTTWSDPLVTSLAATVLLVSFNVPDPVVSSRRLLSARLNENSASSVVGGGQSWGVTGNGNHELSGRSYQLTGLSQDASRRAAARALLHRWLEKGDEAEQQATLAYLMEALDADRTSDRKLFP